MHRQISVHRIRDRRPAGGTRGRYNAHATPSGKGLDKESDRQAKAFRTRLLGSQTNTRRAESRNRKRQLFHVYEQACKGQRVRVIDDQVRPGSLLRCGRPHPARLSKASPSSSEPFHIHRRSVDAPPTGGRRATSSSSFLRPRLTRGPSPGAQGARAAAPRPRPGPSAPLPLPGGLTGMSGHRNPDHIAGG